MSLWKKKPPKMHRTRLGVLLVKHGADPVKVDAAMTEYYGRTQGMSGEYCRDVGACTQGELDRALAEQAAEREDFGEASKYLSSAMEETHKQILEHLNRAREQVTALIESHKEK